MADTTIKHVKDSLIDEAGNKTVFYNRNTVEDVMVGDTSNESIQGHINYLATCNTAANVAAKVITVGDGTTNVLKKGVSFDITFTNGNSAKAATVSVNGSAAVSLTNVTATTIKAGQTVHFVYNGTGLITSGGSGSGTKVTTGNIVGEGTTGEKYVAMVDGADDNSEITFDKKTKVTNKGLEAEVGASTVKFTDQSAEANTDYRTSSALTSGENLATGFAKLKKILAGLGSVAFKPSIGTTELDTTLAEAYNNRLAKTDLYEGLDYATAGEKALDAKAGLTLQNGLTELNSKVEVNGDMTMGEMVEEIYNTTVSTTPKGKIVGTVTGSGTINISNTIEKFAELTSSNFLIVITQAPYTNAGLDNNGYCLADGCKPSLSYNASTGVISIGGLSQSIHVQDKSGWNRVAATQNITANIIMI